MTSEPSASGDGRGSRRDMGPRRGGFSRGGGRDRQRSVADGDRSRPRRRSEAGRPPVVDEPRLAALELLGAVRDRGAYANLVLPQILREHHLSGRDAALATELAYGACRALGQLDAVIGACSDTPPGDLDGDVLDALRLGAYQMLHTRIPAHAAVSVTVDLVRAGARARAAGFVNAVLRRIAERDLAGWVERLAPADSTDPTTRLAFATAHPRWIVAAFADALAASPADPAESTEPAGPMGPTDLTRAAGSDAPASADASDDTASDADAALAAGQTGSRGPARSDSSRAAVDRELDRALAADHAPAAVHLVARPGRVTREELLAQSGGEPGRFSPCAVYLPGGDPGRIDAVRSGAAAVQDEGSQLVALALAAASLDGSDARWLDLAAGPGGKAALLGALAAQRGAHLDAVEVTPHRADLVRRAVSGLPVTVHTADGRNPGLDSGSFDRVLLDAPCTGLGALRRRPEARWRRTEADVAPLVSLQRELLTSAARLVRPGGVVAYVTCSPHLAETAGVVARRPEALELIDAREYFPGVPHLGQGPTVQLWPHRHGTDAMFCALLRRR